MSSVVNMIRPVWLVDRRVEAGMEQRREEDRSRKPLRLSPSRHLKNKMARKGPTKIRAVAPDPIYHSKMITKLINRCMRDGKKTVTQKEAYRAFEIIKEKTGEEPVKVFETALDNIRPTMEVRSRRVGGAAYQVPMSVRGPRKDSLAIRWLVGAARGRSNSEYHTFAEKLAVEIIDSSKGEGVAVKKRQEIERVAEANRAFAHFRW
jgi:small subunit ribosomal protein S7